MSIVRRNSNRAGIVTIVAQSSRKDLKSGTIRVKSGRRRSSALSQRSTHSLLESIPQGNEAANKLYDKNVGKQFDKFK